MTVRFDDSLSALCKDVADLFGVGVLARSAIVRDAGGRLSVVLPEQASEAKIEEAESKLRSTLGGYARPERLVIDIDAPGARPLLDEANTISVVRVDGVAIHLLDRRIVGSDWLRPPARSAQSVPRIVFSSLKGGVGRSTALSVTAAHLSRRGRRVLAIDFDLEAPGIGTMLLNKGELPPFGTLDFLVENSLSGVDDRFISELAADSILGSEGARVTVVPAIGMSTIINPGNALAKIARAYLEDTSVSGSPVSLSQQFRMMVERFEATSAYDLVLIDARAGLHETTAAAILELGAEVLCFGIDHPQTFLGYKLLMAHLGRFPVDLQDDWRERLRFVNAKASDARDRQTAAEERFLGLYEYVSSKSLPIASTSLPPLTAEDFDVEWDDSLDQESLFEDFSPPPVIHVLEDTHYRDFDPVENRGLLGPSAYDVAFRQLLSSIDEIASLNEPLES